jgi:hypothetical protein
VEAYVGFAIVAVTLAVSIIARAWRRSRQDLGPVSTFDLDRLLDLLAAAVREQWTVAANERGVLEPQPIPVRWHKPSVPVVGPVSAAVEARSFTPLPGLSAVTVRDLQAGQISDLHHVYGGLGSGRLVIIGAPGSGKSVAAVLLVLAALQHRAQLSERDRSMVPVPVLFSLGGWDPRAQRVQDWLSLRLQQTYPLFAGAGRAASAASLLADGKITAILDGLDELPEDLRPTALRALSEQAVFRVVVLARSAEMAAAAAHGILAGAAAVELQDVDPHTVADYLTRAQFDPLPLGWRELINRLRHAPDSLIAQALSSPLTLSLVRVTYRSGDAVHELLDTDRFSTLAAVEDHILSQLVGVAYAARPGEPDPHYAIRRAERWLGHAAQKMSQNGTRDLGWWDVPEWRPAWIRNAAAGLIYGLLSGVAFWLVGGLRVGLVGGLVLGLTVGVGRYAVARLEALQDMSGTLSPILSWRRDIKRSLLIVLGFGLMVGFAVGFAGGIAAGLMAGLLAGLAVGLASSTAWATTLTSIQLWRLGEGPIRLVSFLEDARERGVLRVIGPAYQFRHARLQDRLAVAYATETATTTALRVQELLDVPPGPDGQLPRLSTVNPYQLGASASRYGTADRRGRDPYVQRQADDELLDALSSNNFVLLTGPSC